MDKLQVKISFLIMWVMLRPAFAIMHKISEADHNIKYKYNGINGDQIQIGEILSLKSGTHNLDINFNMPLNFGRTAD